MVERDLTAEAKSWRERLNPVCLAMVASMDDDQLTRAYVTWWEVYTRGIRNAPSNRSGLGVSSTDAAEAGGNADRAVLALAEGGAA
jgi:hypothetical protein